MSKITKISVVFTHLSDKLNPEIRIFYRDIKGSINLDKDYIKETFFIKKYNFPEHIFISLNSKEKRNVLFNLLKTIFQDLKNIYIYEYENMKLDKLCTIGIKNEIYN